jgi:hypothetical protein
MAMQRECGPDAGREAGQAFYLPRRHCGSVLLPRHAPVPSRRAGQAGAHTCKHELPEDVTLRPPPQLFACTPFRTMLARVRGAMPAEGFPARWAWMS